MYSTVSRLRPASASAAAAATLAAARTCSPSTTMTMSKMVSPALAHRSYATGSGKNLTDMFANQFDKFKSMITRRKQREEAEKEKAAAAPTPAASDEAVMRKAREEAKIAAVERAKAKARARREAEAALPPSMSVDEVIRSVLQAEGIVKVTADEQQQLSKKIVGEENRVALDDLALKGKLVAALVCEARVHLAHADMTKARTVGDLRALAKEASGAEPVVKHPVAAWFTKQQAAGKLPPNVQFVAYSKKDKLKLKEMY